MPTRQRKDTTKVEDRFGNQLTKSPSSLFGELVTVEPQPEFQLEFQYSINPRQAITTVTGIGVATTESSMCKLSTGASATSSAEMISSREIKYRAGQSTLIRFSCLFTTGVVGSDQLVGYGDDDDGLFFGFMGADFAIIQRRAGSDIIVKQVDWNLDKMNGEGKSGINLDVTKGNSFQIEFQIFGVADFSIEDPSTGVFTKVHRISYPNTQIIPILDASSLPLFMKVENTTNTSDIILRSASIAGLNQGAVFDGRGVLNSGGNNVGNITSEVPIFSLRSKETFLGKKNRVNTLFQFVTMSTFGTEPVIIRVKIDGTLTGASFNDISASTSIMEIDKVATAITGGLTVIQFDLMGNDSLNFDLLAFGLSLPPNTDFTVTAESTKKNDVSMSTTWRELF